MEADIAKGEILLMDESSVSRAITRMSHEILEKNKGPQELVLVGIRRRGASLAAMLQSSIARIEGVSLPCAALDIQFYRDDLTRLSESPLVRETTFPFPVADKRVILVDDVLFTGRTVRAAIEAIFALGRPQCIRLAVLIDRGHRELPIRADYVGKNIPTALRETVAVRVPEYDGQTCVTLLRP